MEPQPLDCSSRRPFGRLLEEQGFAILDGGLAIQLREEGAACGGPLWTAQALLDNPAAVKQVHLAYLRAGADIVLTATYQASISGLAEVGFPPDGAREALMRGSRLACRARDEFLSEAGATRRARPLVAASVGPYGATLADGSEYSGDYGLSVEELARFHRPRWKILMESPCDFLACETIPSGAEARAIIRLAGVSPAKEVWLSVSCRDECRLWDGTPLSEIAQLAEESDGLSAIGVNCSDPRFADAQIDAIQRVCSKPIVVYPNSGGTYDATTKRWTAGRNEDWAANAVSWLDRGAAVVGGCCEVGPQEIGQARLAASRQRAAGLRSRLANSASSVSSRADR